MEITEKQLFDYIQCPAKYDIIHNMKIDFPIIDSYKTLLSTASRYFYMNLLNGKVTTYAELKTKWDSIAEKSGFMDAKKTLSGWSMIVKMTKWAEQKQILIGDVETRYVVQVNGHLVHGNIETVLVNKDKTIELLVTNFSDKLIDRDDINMKLKYGLDMIGFKNVYGVSPIGIKVHSVKFDEDFLTVRTEPDIKRVTKTVENVIKGIENKIFYPRESSFCKTCKAIQYCKYWGN